MAELTPEQLQAAEKMSLDELRAAAIAEAGEVVTVEVTPNVAAETVKQARDAQGKFTNADTIDNTAEVVEEEPAEEEPVAKTIYRKEIDNGNGSVDVYEADSLEELVEKLATGKLHANKKIQEFIQERKAAGVQEQQISKDDEYLVQQKLKDNPKATIKSIVAEVVQERIDREREWNDTQNRFIATHPDFYPCPDNGNRISSEAQRLGLPNTGAGLEKAYQSLKASGLLVQRPSEANVVAEVDPNSTEQTAQAGAGATQQRVQRKGSGVSTKSGSRTTQTVNTQTTEDEAYKMPLEKLKELADKQLAETHRQS